MRPAAPCWVLGPCPAGGGRFPGSQSRLSPDPQAEAAADPFSHPTATFAELEPGRPGPSSRPGKLSSGMLLPKSLIPPRRVTGRGRAAVCVQVRAPGPGVEQPPLPGRQRSAPLGTGTRSANWLRATGLPGGWFVHGAPAAESGSPVAEAPSALHRLPASSLQAQDREGEGWEVQRPLHSQGTGGRRFLASPRPLGSRVRPSLSTPTLGPARAPSAPCRPQLHLAMPPPTARDPQRAPGLPRKRAPKERSLGAAVLPEWDPAGADSCFHTLQPTTLQAGIVWS